MKYNQRREKQVKGLDTRQRKIYHGGQTDRMTVYLNVTHVTLKVKQDIRRSARARLLKHGYDKIRMDSHMRKDEKQQEYPKLPP